MLRVDWHGPCYTRVRVLNMSPIARRARPHPPACTLWYTSVPFMHTLTSCPPMTYESITLTRSYRYTGPIAPLC